MTSDLVTYLRALDTAIRQRNEARAEVEQLTRDRAALLAEVERLREALRKASCACSARREERVMMNDEQLAERLARAEVGDNNWHGESDWYRGHAVMSWLARIKAIRRAGLEIMDP